MRSWIVIILFILAQRVFSGSLALPAMPKIAVSRTLHHYGKHYDSASCLPALVAAEFIGRLLTVYVQNYTASCRGLLLLAACMKIGPASSRGREQ